MENQEKILDHIKRNPGHTQSQITYRLEIPQSTIKYHLLQLIKENKVFSEKLFKTHYFPFIILLIKTIALKNIVLCDFYVHLLQ